MENSEGNTGSFITPRHQSASERAKPAGTSAIPLDLFRPQDLHRVNHCGLDRLIAHREQRNTGRHQTCERKDPPPDLDMISVCLEPPVGPRPRDWKRNTACDENQSLVLNIAQLRELLKLALSGARQTRRIAPQGVSKVWDHAKWSQTAEMLIASERFKGAAQMCKRVEQIASVAQNDAPTKRKAHPVSAPEAKESKRKKVA